MKRLFVLFCMLASFIACSDDKNNDPEPETPITDMQFPKVNPVTGDNVTIVGKGFAADCQIQLKPAGAETAIDATIVEVTDAAITFKVSEELVGKCKVILLQGGKTYELGELTFEEAPDVESTLYGVFADETETTVRPIDVTAQRIGKPLFSLDGDIEGIVADNHGVVYYKAITFEENKSSYELRYYDTKAGKGGKINWEEAPSCFSISTDGEKLYALTYDTESSDINLYSVARDGNAELLQTYKNTREGNYHIRFYSTGGTFLYGEEYLYAGLRLDVGKVMINMSLRCKLSDDFYNVFGNENGLTSYHYVKTEDTYYVFKNNEYKDEPGAIVYKFDDEYDLQDTGDANPAITTIPQYFVNQIYDPTTKMIYGIIGDDGEGILPFDPKTEKVLDPWVGSGCVALVYIK